MLGRSSGELARSTLKELGLQHKIFKKFHFHFKKISFGFSISGIPATLEN